MLKKHMAACLVASAFITMPVLAQTSTSPGAMSPGASQPAAGASSGTMSSPSTQPSSGATMSSSGASASGTSGRFVTQQQQAQWRASKLIGINVYGADNERIGDINEVLVDRQGNADAVVVGVGGFLGIGEKNVALPFNAFEWQMDDTRRTASGTTATGGSTGGTAAAPRATDPATPAGTTASAPAATAPRADTAGTTASTTTASTSNSAARSSGADRGYPDHAVLRMTKADLQNAPTFRYVGDRSTDDRSTSGAARPAGSAPAAGTGAGGTTTAPRQ